MNKYQKYILLLLILLIGLVYLPSIFVFFSGDDWFHLRITQIHSIGEFLNFFSFSHTPQSASFYRPLPTQVFFYIFQTFFGLTAWPYHLFVLICFLYSLYLVFLFAQQVAPRNDKHSQYFPLLATLIYGFSASNFTRLYFLSAFQEISLVIFSLLCLLSFPKSRVRSLIFFILALLSKETAVVLPLLLVLFHWKSIKKDRLLWFVFGVILFAYLYLRLKVFGFVVGDSYTWNFSISKIANTGLWYSLWSIGVPEFMVDYVASGLSIIPKFFIDFPVWWRVLLPVITVTLLSLVIQSIKNIKWLNLTFAKYLLFFCIALLPVIFLPSHKFALELGLPLVGFALAVAYIVLQKPSHLTLLFISFYVFLNLLSNYLTLITHYSVSRGVISRNVYLNLSQKYPQYPRGKYFEFVNDTGDFGSEWGQSKQISQSLSGSDFFRVFYKSPGVNVYYQDEKSQRPESEKYKPIYLGTQQFLP